MTSESYLHMRNQTIVVEINGKKKASIPAHTIDSIVCFGKNIVSTPLIGFCAEKGISIVFFIQNMVDFMEEFVESVSGNVLLRKKQYESLE